jgi:nucleoside phosphorylase
MPSTSLPNEDYTVGWICALPLEAAAAAAMLDEIHEKPRKQPSNDHNIYTLGRIGEHNVVISCLPAGACGSNPATTVATQMLSNFESIRVGLMVGIGGGVPSTERDIRLGDVVVSKLGGMFGGVVQYDRGKTVKGKFERIGSLNKPPQVLLSAVSAMEKRHIMRENKISEFLGDILRKYPKMQEKFSYQSTQHDLLFATHDRHSSDDNKSESRPVKRLKYRSPGDPVVHYGLIASGNQVIQDAATRDQLRQDLGGDVLCFEMEAASLMDTFPCVVIRGICGYVDYHKNDLWQGYAAASAAACAKELLSIIQRNRAADTLTAADRPSASRTVCFAVPFERDSKFIGREDVITEIDRQFEVQRRVALAGIGGVGWVYLVMRVEVSLIHPTGNLRSPLNTAIDSETSTLKAMSSGYMPALSTGWIKHIRTLQGSSVCLAGTIQTLTHSSWSQNGSVTMRMDLGY